MVQRRKWLEEEMEGRKLERENIWSGEKKKFEKEKEDKICKGKIWCTL